MTEVEDAATFDQPISIVRSTVTTDARRTARMIASFGPRVPDRRVRATLAVAVTFALMIREAMQSDVPILVALIEELAEFERARDQVEIDETALDAAMFGPEPALSGLVSLVDDHVVAMALYHRSFSTWTGRPGIYLEDLYVRPAYRGRGLGRSLLSALASRAVEGGCARLEWAVLDWNTRAIEFYRSIGAVPMDEWTRYRLAGDALRNVATSASV